MIECVTNQESKPAKAAAMAASITTIQVSNTCATPIATSESMVATTSENAIARRVPVENCFKMDMPVFLFCTWLPARLSG